MNRVDVNWAAAMFLMVSCWASVSGQEVEDVIRVETAMVTVNVAVTDSKGRHIPKLKAEDFLVSDEGNIVRPEFFDTQGPTSIIFVVDVSSSMGGDKWEKLKDGMKKFLAVGREDSDYTLITFNDAPRLIAVSVSAQEFWREFSTLKTSGDTALYDGVLLAFSSLERAHQRHRTLVLLSDGQDNSSSATLHTVQRETLSHNASIYAVGIVRQDSRTDEERRGEELLDELAEATGGLVLAAKPNEIGRVLIRISADLRSRYSLSYYPPDKTPGWRRIQVNISQSPSRLNLRYQQRYLIR